MVFAKWRPRAPRPELAPEPADPFRSRPTWKNFFYWAVIGLISSNVWRKHVRPRLLPAEPPAAAPAAASAPAASADAVAPEADPYARLQPILDQINSELSGHGVAATLNDLKHDFQPKTEMLHPAAMLQYGSAAGLPPPTRRDFDAVDNTQAQGHATLFLQGGERAYGSGCPPPAEGTQECWERPVGNKVVGYAGMGQDLVAVGARLDYWHQRHWQPHNGRWAPYDEAGERQIISHFIDTVHGFAAESKDREASRAALAREIVDPRRSELNLRRAVVDGYRTVLAREGYRRRLEIMDSWGNP